MGRFTTQGFDELSLSFSEIAALPDSTLDNMLLAEAEVVSKAQKAKASSMLQGPYYQGGVSGAVTIGKVKRLSDGKAVFITFKGKQHGTRLDVIAFMNEFGKQGQPARPFIKTANEESSGTSLAASEKVYDNWLKEKGL